MKLPALFLIALACGAPGMLPALADDAPTVPGDGYPASRYSDLWTKSPFAVATAEAAPDSPDFQLVGVATVDGVSYASVIDKKTQEHFLVTSTQPSDGLTLTSINPGHDGSDTIATMQRGGQAITLKLESTALAGGAPPPPGMIAPPVNSMPMPGTVPPSVNIPMPGNGGNASSRPMLPRYRRPPIHLPPPPSSSNPVPSIPPPPNQAPSQ